MNSFQNQFNSLLGIALGAKKLGTPKAPTAKAPKVSQTKNLVEAGEKGELKTIYEGFNPNNLFMTSTASLDPVAQKAYEAKQRSLQNLYNRHEALRAIKLAREKTKGAFENPLGKTTIMSHNKGGMI